MNFHEIFTPEDRAAGAPEREMETARATGRSSDIRWHLCKDQSRIFVEGVLNSVRDETGCALCFSKIARAVRPQHAAGTMIDAILEGTADAIYALDTEGRFVFANTQAAGLFGRNVDSLVGQTLDHVLPPALAADMRATDESVMGGVHPRLIEEKFPVSNGRERVMLATKAPWRDSEGRLIGVATIAKDVTARTAHHSERERLLREIRRTNEELSAFSHIVAHDLRTPLRAVRTYTELLAEHMEGRLDSTARQFMTFVIKGAESMEQLIESLLRYAESGDELSAGRVDVNAVIEGLLHRFEPLIKETSAVITIDPLPEVHADPVRILQLFQNLIVNAINYRGTEAPRIRISAAEAGDEYRFSVSDNGIGIAREHFDRIFMPLKRLHSKNVPGSGIGLALCRKIVERHGGRIWVESIPGKGSTFFFTLPVHPHSGPE